MSSKLTEQQLAEIRESFALFDKNGDGTISAEELGEVMKSLGQCPSVEELGDMMREVDEDGDGNISFEEFCHMMTKRIVEDDERREKTLKRAFAIFDRDGNGLISAAELKKVMESIGENVSDQEIDDMIKEADKNGDGFVDYNEFVKIVSSGYNE